MDNYMNELVYKLMDSRKLETEEYIYLIRYRDHDTEELLREHAVKVRKENYGNEVLIRGLIEVSNICKNDCLYCGIRKSNWRAERYRLSEKEILSAAETGYRLGFKTFVLQGGEDAWYTDERLEKLIRQLKKRYPDCAVTLSLGERGRESFERLRAAGADRYLLRHETADREHYRKLHPQEMSFEHRMECLMALKELGFQTGAGFMVGSPFQTTENLARDLKFLEEFQPEMCGIGPFIPHHDTPFSGYSAGSVELTCFLLSVIRIICPKVLLPATTALGTLDPEGREKGILSGANVVMPNLSPANVRGKYLLYDGKLATGAESAENLLDLKRRMEKIGYVVVEKK